MKFKVGDLVQISPRLSHDDRDELHWDITAEWGFDTRRVKTIMEGVGRVIEVDAPEGDWEPDDAIYVVRWTTKTKFSLYPRELTFAIGAIMKEAVGEV